LRVIAEHLSRIGVPVFMADVKGDLSGIAHPGQENPKIAERVSKLGVEDFQYLGYPIVFWDLYGQQGHPVRTTISDMGPLLMSRLLKLNETQSGVLTLAFKIADDNGLLLLDLKDLRAMLQHVGDNAAQFKTQYGNVSAASIGAIQRALLALEEQGADNFFGEPALDLDDMMQTDTEGRGVINILTADKLINAPKLYATFLLWMLAELFERLPEVGDPEKPKLVFFFDEAHLLFDDAPKALLEKIEQVVRLIRSKGIGVYFVTQNPLDVPDVVPDSWVTVCNMRSARSRRGTRRPSKRPRKRSGRIPNLMSKRLSPSSVSAKHWFRSSTRRGGRISSTVRWSIRRKVNCRRSRRLSVTASSNSRASSATTKKSSIGNPPTKC
jgi:DNA helicase HerA-like ATPase